MSVNFNNALFYITLKGNIPCKSAPVMAVSTLSHIIF